MNIIAVDDEKLALEGILKELARALPEAEINGFRNAQDALSFCEGKKSRVDVAFLDIEMPGMGGVLLGRSLMERYPEINIIFTTGYSEYAVEAIDMRCSGYILKPVTAQKLLKELNNLRYPVKDGIGKRLYVKAFGKFEVQVEGKPLRFRYQKTKELLAYLVDRRGELCSNNEIISVLWEDESPESSHISYLKNIRSDLMNTLEENGCAQCIIRTRGEMGVLCDRIDCDFYDYLANRDKTGAERLFKGEYMSQYSWGEYTLAALLGELAGWN